MGQKLSDLKGLLVTIVGEDETGGKENESNETLSKDNLKSEKPGQVCSGCESVSLKQNDVGNAKEHFENIYSNSSESGVRAGELNGSILVQSLPHSQCDGGKQPCTSSVKTKTKLNKSRKGSEEEHGNTLKRKSLRTMSFVNKRRSRGKSGRTKDSIGDNVKKRSNWVLKFNCAKLKPGLHGSSSSFVESDIPQPNIVCDSCVCTGYRRTEEHHLGAGIVFEANTSGGEHSNGALMRKSFAPFSAEKLEELMRSNPVIDLSKFNPDDFPIEDCDERARLERAKEIVEGVEPPPGFQPGQNIQLVLCQPEFTLDHVVSKHLTMFFQSQLGLRSSVLSQINVIPPALQRIVHTQVDFIHCLVPDLLQITLSSFYWGKMNRFEAERLLEGRPEGTFLLRDSSQEEYIFSVSFRRYGRSLHARVEQWNHMFSFDSHDPGVYSSPTVCGLLEHYKDPSCCMFFEPMLVIPLHRNFAFPLQHLCRATVCSRTKYDSINQLNIPRALKSYLKEYHYKQRIRVRKYDAEV